MKTQVSKNTRCCHLSYYPKCHCDYDKEFDVGDTVLCRIGDRELTGKIVEKFNDFSAMIHIEGSNWMFTDTKTTAFIFDLRLSYCELCKIGKMQKEYVEAVLETEYQKVLQTKQQVR